MLFLGGLAFASAGTYRLAYAAGWAGELGTFRAQSCAFHYDGKHHKQWRCTGEFEAARGGGRAEGAVLDTREPIGRAVPAVSAGGASYYPRTTADTIGFGAMSAIGVALTTGGTALTIRLIRRGRASRRT